MRIDKLINDEEYSIKRKAPDGERFRIQQRRDQSPSAVFEPARNIISFMKHAGYWFEKGDDEAKQLVLQTVGSNPTLKSQMITIQAKKPFRPISKKPKFPYCGQLYGTLEP